MQIADYTRLKLTRCRLQHSVTGSVVSDVLEMVCNIALAKRPLCAGRVGEGM